MILYNTKQVRVFNGEGKLKERELLLKLFNNYSIKKFIKFIKIVEIQLKLTFNKDKRNLFFSKGIKNFLNDLDLIMDFEKNKKLKIFLIKKFLIFYFFHYFKNYLKYLNNLKIINFHHFAKKSFLSSKFNSLKTKFFKELNLKEKLRLPINYLRKINDRNIFIVGEVYNFYRGSITPFYNSKFSWFISTGLKSDVEAGDVDLFSQRKDKDKDLINNSENKFKSIVLKLNNFNTHVKSGIKKKARHLFYYNLSNFFGFQRFISESKSSYNYKLNNYSLLEQSCFFTRLKIKTTFDFFFPKSYIVLNNFFFNKTYFGSNFNQNYNINYGSNLNRHFIKFIFILFQSSKSILTYYTDISKEILNIMETTITIYRSLFSFINLKQKYNKIIKNLFSSLFSNLSFSKYKLVKNRKYSLNLYFINLFNIVLQSFQLNLYFLNKVLMYISKNSFFDVFFGVYLLRKKRQILVESLDRGNLTIKEKTNIFIQLLHKPYWLGIYKKFLFYLYFIIDWKINFDLLLVKGKEINFLYYDLIKKIQKPFKLLKIKWHISFFVNIKELYFFIFTFLEEIVIDLKKLFFYYSYKKNNKKFNFSKLFLFFNLYIYIYKLKNKDMKSDNMYLTNIIKLSSFFLGKWFYYRHLQKFINNNVDYNYTLVNPFKLLNCNFTAVKLQFKSLKGFTLYRKKKVWSKYKEYKSRFLMRLKLISDIKLKVYKYRSTRWFKKLIFYSNNILKKGLFFKQPRIPKGLKLWKNNDSFYSDNLLFRLPKKREILAKYNKHYLSSFYKRNNVKFSNTFLILYSKINTKLKKNYSYYNFWF